MKNFAYLEKARAFAAQLGDDWRKFAEIAATVRKEAVMMEETLVPEYVLPSPLEGGSGPVRTAAQWSLSRRQEILKLYEEEMFGKIPPRPDRLSFELLSQKEGVFGGLARRREVRIHCRMNNGREFSFDLLLYIPEKAAHPVPAFLGLNFKGNHGCTAEKDVRMTPERFNDGRFATREEAAAFYGAENMLNVRDPEFYSENARGCQAHRWCFEEILKRGYAAGTICYEDIFPDNPNGWEYSALGLFEDDLKGYCGNHPCYTAIGVWSWGLMRALDYLETVPEIDASRICVHGHSRLGKTALWAGACDQRFKMVISNDSGCGGAALSRRVFGENFLFIVNCFPHWFVRGTRKYMGNEDKMPFDQHFLLSLAAPRPLVVASATEDLWADPKGEFLSALHTREVYGLFGSQGLPAEEMPEADVCITGDVSYHLRTGKHDQTPFDWAHYLDIADIYLK